MNVENDYVGCPIGWYGRVGNLIAQNIRNLLIARRPAIGPALGIKDDDEFEMQLEATMVRYKECKSWYKYVYAYGQKP